MHTSNLQYGKRNECIVPESFSLLDVNSQGNLSGTRSVTVKLQICLDVNDVIQMAGLCKSFSNTNISTVHVCMFVYSTCCIYLAEIERDRG